MGTPRGEARGPKNLKKFFPKILSFLGQITYFGMFFDGIAKKRPYLVVLVGFNFNSAPFLVTFAKQNLVLKPTTTTKHGHFLSFFINKHPKVSDLTQKTQNFEKKFFCDFWAPMPPP